MTVTRACAAHRRGAVAASCIAVCAVAVRKSLPCALGGMPTYSKAPERGAERRSEREGQNTQTYLSFISQSARGCMLPALCIPRPLPASLSLSPSLSLSLPPSPPSLSLSDAAADPFVLRPLIP